MSKLLISLIISFALFGLTSSILASSVTISNPLQSGTIPALLEKITLAVAGIVGAISVIMIIVAGIMYLLSAGNPEKINSAKKALTYAIAGLAIALVAGGIIETVKWIIGA